MCISMTGATASDLAAIATQFADPDGAGPRAGTDVIGSGTAGAGAAGTEAAGTEAAGAEHGSSVATGSAPAGA